MTLEEYLNKRGRQVLDKYQLQGKLCGNLSPDSFCALMCIEGKGLLLSEGQEYPLKKGDGLFLESGEGTYLLDGDMEILAVTV